MAFGYRLTAALAAISLCCSPVYAAHKRVAAPGRAHARTEAAYAPGDLYSRRALRRARTILQLKLLELREARLERVRRAIERHLPVDQLLKEPHGS